MHFTEGPLREYERMMQEKPRNDRKPVKTMQERACKYCMHYDKQSCKCSEEKCILFDD